MTFDPVDIMLSIHHVAAVLPELQCSLSGPQALCSLPHVAVQSAFNHLAVINDKFSQKETIKVNRLCPIGSSLSPSGCLCLLKKEKNILKVILSYNIDD